MFRNYLKITLRNLRRHPGYTFINVAGLALGIACCLLIGLYVQNELSYDRHHENGAHIYRVDQQVNGEGAADRWAWTGGGLGADLAQDFPELDVVRLHYEEGTVRYAPEDDPTEQRSFREPYVAFVDSAWFDVFTHPFVQGDARTAFTDPASVILTETTARRYFGEANPIGQELIYNGRLTLTVTGVVEDVPSTSHLPMDLIAPMAAFKQYNGMAATATFGSYWWPYSYTYVRAPDAATAARVETQLPAFVQRHREATEAAKYVPTLGPLFDIHLHSDARFGPTPAGSLALVRIFTVIALAVLVLACINFMNLSTARSAKRAREVGVRKTVGAHRGQIVFQFLNESVLLSLAALLLAVGLVELTLPLFNDLAATDLRVGYASNAAYWIGLVALVTFTGLVAGSYPAFYLSGFRPARVLKGSLTGKAGGARLRKGLVVFQFAVSIALIAGTIIAVNQLRYMQEANLGFEKEQVVAVRVPGGIDWPVLKQTFAAQALVQDVTASTQRPGFGDGSALPYQTGTPKPIEAEAPSIAYQFVDYGFFDVMGLEIVAGRAFDPERRSDIGVRPEDQDWFHLYDRGFVINETAARENGWTPEEALGQRLRVYAYENGTFYTDVRGEVVGVVENYHYASLRSEIGPMLFTLAEQPGGGHNAGWALVKVVPGNAKATMDALQETWRQAAPEQPFEASFLDQSLDTLYLQEARLGQVIGAFALVGIVIACLGLFGLAAYAAEQRTKEIGVRKVLGASVAGIVGLLSRDFLALVLVATCIAVPVAYLAMQQWLDDFAYRINVSPLLFVAVALLALLIAFATVGFQAYRAARLDPVKTLRYE